jgi:BlaR1 peptidase M56
MDRELVLAVLVALLCGGALAATAWWPSGLPAAVSGRGLERQAWRRLWLPFTPALLVFAALCGWALVEPACAERLPNCLLWGAMPFAAILLRATWRAWRSLTSPYGDQAVATVGLFRPRLIVSPRLVTALDERALAAALAHERAHARHHDPLRLWLAQLGSDLLWPWPMAAARLQEWRSALEVARDEEARVSGITGPDLAAAILASLRITRGTVPLSTATLGGDVERIEQRLARLLRPLEAEFPASRAHTVRLLLFAAGMAVAVLLGSAFGEPLVRSLLAAV